MNERIEDVPATSEIVVNEEERAILMQYLKNSSVEGIREEAQIATDEEREIAGHLLDLEDVIRRGDSNGYSSFGDSNYNPDVALRMQALKQAGLEASEGRDLELQRHDIILYRGTNQLPLKVINLIERNKIGDQNGIRVKDGVVFIGTSGFDGPGLSHSLYKNLTEEQKERVKKFIEAQASK